MNMQATRVVSSLSLLTAALFWSGCAASTFSSQIEEAHGDQSLYAMAPLHADIRVEFGGQTLLDGQLTYDAATGRSRLDQGAATAVFDGTEVWSKDWPTPQGAPPARFHALTWPWFVSAPWKLQDPGSSMTEPATRMLRDGVARQAARMTYEAGVGDTPDDWYVVYASPAGGLEAVAYIVTFGTTVEAAEADPHAATYDRFVEVDGMRVPAELTFWNWNAETGVVGEPIGKATFTNVRFADADATTFTKPDGATKG